MSCQDFEFVSIELARGSLIDAAAREAAREHAGSCAPCAARLRRERALSAALREVGASMREREAPAHVEAALLAALRERCVAAANNAAAANNVAASAANAVEVVGAPMASRREVVAVSRREVGIGSRFAPRVRRALFAAAVAASLVLALAAAWRARTQKSYVNQIARDTRLDQGDKPTAGGQSDPKNDQDGAQSTKKDQTAEKDQTLNGDQTAEKDQGNQPTTPTAVDQVAATDGRNVARAGSRRRVRGAVESLPIVFREDGGRVTPDDGAAVGSPVVASAADLAATSDFVPLTAADGAAPLDSGQMVRVRVTRAALAALGLPVNASRAGETVKADVLLGHDGTARAIRLLP
jgi:hypothetical protein